MQSKLQELAQISQAIGLYPDYVQGGGGNTSVKIDDKLMAIKASGYELKDVTEKDGFALVSFPKIREFFSKNPASYDDASQTLNITANTETIDDEYSSFVKSNTQGLEGYPKLRPSMETGFHALLGSHVIHSHSCYANLINCSKQGGQTLAQVFAASDLKPICVPYTSPGYFISALVGSKLNEQDEYVLFLQNHGLICSAMSAERALELHNQVNLEIIKYFDIQDSFPAIELEQKSNQEFSSTNEFILANAHLDFTKLILFPDQVVYLTEDKIKISSKEINYHCASKEAETIEQTLCAYLYILKLIQNANLEPNFIDLESAAKISNMESEQYRRSLL